MRVSILQPVQVLDQQIAPARLVPQQRANFFQRSRLYRAPFGLRTYLASRHLRIASSCCGYYPAAAAAES
jgi:hypothetical protein